MWRWSSRIRQRVARSWISTEGNRRIEKFSCVPKEFQENLKSNLQQQLQEVEQRRHELMSRHQKVQKRSQKIHSFQEKRRNMQKKVLQHKRRCGSSEGQLVGIRSDFGICRTKSMRTEMAAELQRLQPGEERRGSNASQTGDCCMEALWQQFIALEANRIQAFVQRLQREMGTSEW